MNTSSDIALLTTTFPSWSFGTVWVTVSSGPDQRRLIAVKGDTTLSAWDADSLASQIVAEQLAAALREQDGES